MNRAHIIIGLIVVSTLIAPSMFCLIPGAALTEAEAECCRQMGPQCGDVQMSHACCKPSKPAGEFSWVAQARLELTLIETAIIDNLIGIRLELQSYRDGNGFSNVALHLSPSNQSLNILRI